MTFPLLLSINTALSALTASTTDTSSSWMYTKMETEKRESRLLSQPILMVFIAVTFTVALLEGVGLILVWTHFSNTEMRLDSRISAVEIKILEQGTVTEGPTQGTGLSTGSLQSRCHYKLQLYTMCVHETYMS